MKRKIEKYPLNQSPFFKLRTKRKLAGILAIEIGRLKTYRRADRLYTERDIPKKNGDTRRIENPRRDLKILQARIARLLNRIAVPDYLYCPVKGRSYVTNAAQHRGHRVVRTLDVKKYFPNTSRNHVYHFFSAIMRCSADVAEFLTNIATFKGHLPTGSPLSPIMAFYAHYETWEEVHRLVTQEGAVNSLYIDDLTVSGARVPDRLMWDVKKAIHRAGLRYHKEKTFRDRPAEITGVIVRNNDLLPPNRQLLKRHKAQAAFRKANTQIEKEMLAVQLKGLEGQIAQIKQASKGRRWGNGPAAERRWGRGGRPSI